MSAVVSIYPALLKPFPLAIRILSPNWLLQGCRPAVFPFLLIPSPPTEPTLHPSNCSKVCSLIFLLSQSVTEFSPCRLPRSSSCHSKLHSPMSYPKNVPPPSASLGNVGAIRLKLWLFHFPLQLFFSLFPQLSKVPALLMDDVVLPLVWLGLLVTRVGFSVRFFLHRTTQMLNPPPFFFSYLVCSLLTFETVRRLVP